MSAFVHIAARFLNAGRGRCERCSRVTDLLSGRTVTGVERDMCAGCWAPDSCRVVDYPAEMGPFYCPADCAATGPADHEEGCEWRCSSPGCREELGSTRERQCGVCIDHDDHGYDPDAARALRADLDAFHGGE